MVKKDERTLKEIYEDEEVEFIDSDSYEIDYTEGFEEDDD